MKTVVASKLLGIALGEKSLSLAEVHIHGEEYKVVHAAQMPYPEGVGLNNPTDLGKALRQCIRSAGISARLAAIGLPARWILSRRRDLPPVKPEAAAGALRLAAESEFASEASDLCVDFAGESSAASATQVLLVATSTQRITQCRTLAQAAGLKLREVMPTGAAWQQISGRAAKGGTLILNLAPTGSELVAMENGAPLSIRHLMLNNGQCQDPIAVAGEMRRAVAALGAPEGGPRQMLVWGDESGGVTTALQEKLGITTHTGKLSTATAAASEAVAAAVALTTMVQTPGRVNFLDSRLRPPAESNPRRRLMWASGVAAAILLIVVGAWWELSSLQDQLDQTRAHLRKEAPNVKKADTEAKRLGLAQEWMSGKPKFVACLTDITKLFPDEGSIWATSLSLRSDMTGQLTGKAPGEQQVLALHDRLKDSKRFTDLKLLDMRDAGRNSRETAFSISFTYKPE